MSLLNSFETWALGLMWALPISYTLVLGLALLWGLRISEKFLARTTVGLSVANFILSLFVLVGFFAQDQMRQLFDLGPWLHAGGIEFLFQWELDRNSAVLLSAFSLLMVLTGRFAVNYLRGDPGYGRFMFLFSLLQSALVMVISADQLDLLLMGWELMAMASYLLIGFFREHRSAGLQSLRALVHYKIADLGLIMGMVILHFHNEHQSLSRLEDFVARMQIEGSLKEIYLVGFCLIFGSLAKSGQWPFIGWLPKAMEGPTASSASFYGALSVHMGPLWLLKIAPLWIWSPWLCAYVFLTGLLTTTLSSLSAKTMPNIKSQCAYGVMAEVGVIYMEIALGLHTLALVHIIAHAGLRTLQFIRSPSLLADVEMDPALRTRGNFGALERLIGPVRSRKLYIHAMNGFYMEAFFEKILCWFSPEGSLSQKLLSVMAIQWLLFGLSFLLEIEQRLLLNIAFFSQIAMGLIAFILAQQLEKPVGRPLYMGKIQGLAEEFPEHANLFLVAILLMGANPGALMFIAEDLLLNRAMSEPGGLIITLALVLLPTWVSITSYHAYARIFYGRRPLLLQGLKPKISRVWPLRLGMTLSFSLGLVPGLWMWIFG